MYQGCHAVGRPINLTLRIIPDTAAIYQNAHAHHVVVATRDVDSGVLVMKPPFSFWNARTFVLRCSRRCSSSNGHD